MGIKPRNQYGDLGQFQWATQGMNGQPLSAPVQPVEAGDGLIAAMQRFNARGANGQGDNAPSGTSSAFQPETAGAPPEPGSRPWEQFSQDPVEQSIWKAKHSPADLTPADLTNLQYLRDRSYDPGSAGASVTSGTSQTKLGPDYWKSLSKEEQIQQGAAKRGEAYAGELQKQAQTDAEAFAGRADQLKNLAAERASAQAEQAAQMEKLQGDVAKAGADYQKAAAEMDPHRLLKGAKGWGAALAMAFGAYGATLGRTQNFAQQIIDSAIDRDIDTQKTQLAAKKENISLAQQIYQDQRQRFSDKNAAMEATKADMYEIFAAEAGKRAARAKGTEAEKAALDAADNLRLQAQARRTNAFQMEAKTISTSVTQQAGGRAAGYKFDPIKDLKERADTKQEIDKAYPNANGQDWDKDALFAKVMDQVGSYGAAVKSGQELRKSNDNTNAVGRALSRLGLNTNANTEREAHKGEFLTDVIKASSGQAFSEKELKVKEDVLNAGVTSDQKNVGVNAMLKGAVTKIASKLAELPPAGRAEAISRIQRSGFFGPAEIQAINDLSAPKTTAQQGAALGGRSR